MSIENRVAVITGATGGLGRVVTQRLAEAGARLALLSTDTARLEGLAQELGLSPDRTLLHAVNLGDLAATQAAADAVMAKFGRADILVHLVGGYAGGKPVVETPGEDVSNMLQQHVWTTFHLIQAFVPRLAANGWGRVIAISSPNASRPPANGAPYAIGKAAQEALMLTLAQEVKDAGVTANVIVVKKIDVAHERDRAPTPKNASWTTPEEIASMILFLCSDEAQMVNGARIPLYGSP